MNSEKRYTTLIERHRRIEARLDREMKRPLPDYFIVQGLKREKLRIKDEMHAREHLIGSAIQTTRATHHLNA